MRAAALAILPAALLAQTLFPARAVAAGVTIAPAYKYISLEDGRSAEVPIRLSNNTASGLTFRVRAENFTALDDQGGAAVGTMQPDGRYGLREFIVLNTDRITIAPGKLGEVTARIVNNSELTAGGHYGAVVFSLANTGAAAKIPVKQELASLLFVSKTGGAAPKLETVRLDVSTGLFRLPSSADAVIANQGNVHDIPSGNLTLTDPAGRQLLSVPVNSANGAVLPETSRRFVLGLQSDRKAWLPGVYTLALDGNTGRVSRRFVVLPIVSLAGIGVALATLTAGVYALRRRFRHKANDKPARKSPKSRGRY